MWSSSLATWPNNEFRLPAMTSRTQGRPVRSTTSVFLTKSCQRIPRIIRWERMWKTLSFRRSSCRSVHVSEPYNKMDSIQVWYKRSFVQLKPGLSPDFVHRMHGSRSDANAPDNVWLTPARSRLNRSQIPVCKLCYFFQRMAANW